MRSSKSSDVLPASIRPRASGQDSFQAGRLARGLKNRLLRYSSILSRIWVFCAVVRFNSGLRLLKVFVSAEQRHFHCRLLERPPLSVECLGRISAGGLASRSEAPSPHLRRHAGSDRTPSLSRLIPCRLHSTGLLPPKTLRLSGMLGRDSRYLPGRTTAPPPFCTPTRRRAWRRSAIARSRAVEV